MIFLAVLLSNTVLAATPPEWARQNGIQQQGNLLTIISTGNGPSLDLARQSAIDQAKSTAANQINGSASVRSMSIETEKSASYHSEVFSAKKVEGLICQPDREYSEERGGSYSVWLTCKFDVSKARVVSVEESDLKKDPASGRAGPDNRIVKGSDLMNRPPAEGVLPPTPIAFGENKQLAITVVPLCESILVRGKQSRSVPCGNNPVTLLVLPTDNELIVRGPPGYLPKHLDISGRRPASSTLETLEVYLERN